jgi:hypothetical protein
MATLTSARNAIRKTLGLIEKIMLYITELMTGIEEIGSLLGMLWNIDQSTQINTKLTQW